MCHMLPNALHLAGKSAREPGGFSTPRVFGPNEYADFSDDSPNARTAGTRNVLLVSLPGLKGFSVREVIPVNTGKAIFPGF